MFIPNVRPLGFLQKPLSGLVLHFGEGGPSARPSEAAWVALSDIPSVHTPRVRVYVSRSSLKTMTAVYAPLGKRVTVEPLLLKKDELDAQAFLSMMAVGSSESAPLYIQGVLVSAYFVPLSVETDHFQSILRDLGEDFSYDKFMKRLEGKKESFNPAQLTGLEQRMALLTSFLDTRPNSSPRTERFAAGQLTIADLSDPFIDPASACGLFEIITRLFVRAEVGTGKVLVVDEAHKVRDHEQSLCVAHEPSSLVSVSTQDRIRTHKVLVDAGAGAAASRYAFDHQHPRQASRSRSSRDCPFLTCVPRTNRRSPGSPRSVYRRYLASILLPVLVGAPRETRLCRHLCR
jgi:hypothetical protein